MRVGVVGAGTMGASIAQVAAVGGDEVRLFDLNTDSLTQGMERIRQSLTALERKGRIPLGATELAMSRIRPTAAIADLAPSQLAVEAVPESLEIKRQTFAALDKFCSPECILATNTSSLSVTAIGATTRRPEQVVGLHFFNPVPLMKLVEVVRGALTGERALQVATEAARRWNKTPIQVSDTPGFLVNRVARPFVGEAMRIAGEGTATRAQIDRIARLTAGFRMGPFELMDLIGVDVNLAVNVSVWQQFYCDSRFRPHPSQEQLVQGGLLGRKSGRGWYRYAGNEAVDGPSGPVCSVTPSDKVSLPGHVAVAGNLPQAEIWRKRLMAAGYQVGDGPGAAMGMHFGPLSSLAALERNLQPNAPLLVEASTLSLWDAAGAVQNRQRLVGFGGLLEGSLVELAAIPGQSEEQAREVAAFLGGLGLDHEIIAWCPGMVGARLVAMLANEAYFAWQEGVATPEAIDEAMMLGVNYPRGPIAWARSIGVGNVIGVLACLHRELGDDRYRTAAGFTRDAFIRA